MKKFFFEKEFIVSVIIAVACLFLAGTFPREDGFQVFILGAFFFLIVPWLYIRIVLDESIKDYGVQLGRKAEGFFWMIFSFFFFLLTIYFSYRYFDFFSNYVLLKIVRENFWIFVGYEFFLVGFFLFLYEFFFHGWIMGFLRRYFGIFSVIFQFIVFVVFLVLTSNFNWNFFPYMIINLLGGWIVYKSRSIWYSFTFGWIAIILLDMIFLRITKM
ncbi:MAG: hypothetical protein UR69_C0002G0039 [Candidatus Moranbacteria bacterium GW2011_GWE2_35_2-]|nr:MAG: hypothetical protein UR69_C0002G0039 [Candidatus Moranbacteria bacterium GW2011_GWE2_35_2-]KKQ06666.1 MAG: hypothetical protein US15_C0006G0011 [Candidatus Moranbacteria bacterium GW2011_GWF1_36_4]KKQ22612.1 MAG: hypothetical protein US37_C0002G0237 [Candidatus Moranbacteria bacterium GW2011_GWF2_37_11]KKQ29015.1 MAG: hypothetical protein US44_C0004G0059 [Candidatus Moranbacteria bacterium GW2011_GWD1_37_17]KKQ30449.1 MAG: hypothetical protein US47_C0002G0039 [Candidatus Moranbacteria b